MARKITSNKPQEQAVAELLIELQTYLPDGIELCVSNDRILMHVDDVDGEFDITLDTELKVELIGQRIFNARDLFDCKT